MEHSTIPSKPPSPKSMALKPPYSNSSPASTKLLAPALLSNPPSALLSNSPAHIRDRVAIGIACCRIVNKQPELLLVCPRCTYAYRTFTRSKYNSNNPDEMIALFNQMTVDEKLDILSLNFMQIWYRMWLNNSFKNTMYFMAKNKYESTFATDNSEQLSKLIAKSTHASRMWEIPKGRKKNKMESNIDCAVREFYEETGIKKKSYRLFPTAYLSYSYIDDGARYTNIYYFAYMRHHHPVQVDLASQQISEIADIKWMNINEIRAIDKTGRLANIARKVFNFVKKRA